MKLSRALAVVLAALTLSSCAALSAVSSFLPGGGEPAPAGEEVEMLYAKGVRVMMPDPIKDLHIQPAERVWIINENGGTNTDRPVDALTADALIDVLREKGISEVVARDDDMIRSLYVEYSESAKLAARSDSLAKDGRLVPADVILAYRVIRLNERSPGYLILGFRYLLAAIVGLVADAQPNNTDGIRLAIHLDAIDAKTGTVRASKIVEHVEPQPDAFKVDYLFQVPTAKKEPAK